MPKTDHDTTPTPAGHVGSTDEFGGTQRRSAEDIIAEALEQARADVMNKERA